MIEKKTSRIRAMLVAAQPSHFRVDQPVKKRSEEKRAVDTRRVNRRRSITKQDTDNGYEECGVEARQCAIGKIFVAQGTKANMPYPIAKGIATAAETNPPLTSSRMFKPQGCGIDRPIDTVSRRPVQDLRRDRMPSRMRIASFLSRFCRLRWNLNPSCSSRITVPSSARWS